MKKILTLMLLISGINIFGAADGFNKEEYDHFVKKPLESGSSVILNKTALNSLSTRTSYENNVYYLRKPAGKIWAEHNIVFSKERPRRHDFNHIKFGEHVNDSPQFNIYSDGIKYTARFVSPQENGKLYHLIENKWDNDTDFVIISQEDLEKKGSVPLLVQLVIKQIEKSIDEKTFSNKDLETLKIIPPLLLTDKINNFVNELKKDAEEKELCEERFGGPPCNIM